MFWKAERQAATPTIGLAPIPSTATVTTGGLQQAYRMAMPGRVMKFGALPYTSSQRLSREISVNWAKFRKSKTRPGDYYGLTLYNDSDNGVTFSMECRYKASI